MITRYDHFCDYQIKRFLMQVVRAFSGFQFKTGARGDKAPVFQMVPCITASRNRQAAAIRRNMSENTLLSVPMITVDLANFTPDRARLQNPDHIDSVHFRERERDAITGEFTGRAGNAMTVERLMPKPFDMTVQVDIWTSTMDQKHQLLEQINTMCFPSFDIQNSDNALDWSALTTAYYEDTTWTSLSIPIGTENEIDVATITFKIPMWLTPPARVSRQTLIHQVVTNVSTADRDEHGVIRAREQMIEHVTTPDDCHLRVERGVLTLLGSAGEETRPDGSVFSWESLLGRMGAVLHPSETQIRVHCDNRDIIGFIQPTEEPNRVLWQPDIDTLPHNTMTAIDGMIDPLRHIPGDTIPAPLDGQRYLLRDDLANNSLVWGAITARVGSIIERRNGAWVVAFSSLNHATSEYLVNRTSGRQLRWSVEEQEWVIAIDGIYSPGEWRLGIV